MTLGPLPPKKDKDVEVLQVEKLPKTREEKPPFTIVLDKSHLWTAFISILFASAITSVTIYGQVATQISANAECTANQVKMSEFSGVGMSVTCVPLDTYMRLKKSQKHKRGAI